MCSGNRILIGKDIRICTPDDDQPSFDSQTCSGRVDLDKERQYGTYNKITGAMNLTNVLPPPVGLRVEGSFKCKQTVPRLK
jgi:hypothetical protein